MRRASDLRPMRGFLQKGVEISLLSSLKFAIPTKMEKYSMTSGFTEEKAKVVDQIVSCDPREICVHLKYQSATA